jgi:putative FmdB family regulatory protein
MPIYEYACQECDHKLDALQKISEAPLVDCPECGEPGLKRLLSAPRFRLKGQGWYETDFKKDNQRNIAGEKDDKKPAEKTVDTSADKTDTKKSVDKKATESKTAGKVDTT